MSNDILPPCFAQYTTPPRRSVMAPKEKKEAKEKKSKAGAAEPAAEAPAAAASAPAAAGGSVDMAELARLKDQVAQMESQLNKQAIKTHSENAVTAKFDVLKQYLPAGHGDVPQGRDQAADEAREGEDGGGAGKQGRCEAGNRA